MAASDISTDVSYETSGSFTIENADPSKADLVEDALKKSISYRKETVQKCLFAHQTAHHLPMAFTKS